GIGVVFLVLDAHVVREQQLLHEVAIGGPDRHAALGVTLRAGALDDEGVFAISNLDGLDVRLVLRRFDELDELAEGPLLSRLPRRHQKLPDRQESDDENDPDKKRLVRLLHLETSIDLRTFKT